MCIAYQRARIPEQRNQHELRLAQRGRATTYFMASLVREPSLAGVEAFSPPTEDWASLEDSMASQDARSRGGVQCPRRRRHTMVFAGLRD